MFDISRFVYILPVQKSNEGYVLHVLLETQSKNLKIELTYDTHTEALDEKLSIEEALQKLTRGVEQ